MLKFDSLGRFLEMLPRKEEIQRTRGREDFLSKGRNACVAAQVPPTLVAKTFVISATSSCSGGSFGWFLVATPALFRRMSSFPCRDITVFTALRSDAGLVVSSERAGA